MKGKNMESVLEEGELHIWCSICKTFNLPFIMCSMIWLTIGVGDSVTRRLTKRRTPPSCHEDVWWMSSWRRLMDVFVTFIYIYIYTLEPSRGNCPRIYQG
jgi:hypothetical protein